MRKKIFKINSLDEVLFYTTKYLMDLEHLEGVHHLISNYADLFDINMRLPKSKMTLLNYAISFNFSSSYYFVCTLLGANADINVTDINGNSPLHRSVLMGKNEITKLLLNKGANIKLKNNDGLRYNQLTRRNSEDDISDIEYYEENLNEQNFCFLNCAYFAFKNNDKILLSYLQTILKNDIDIYFNNFINNTFDIFSESDCKILEFYLSIGAKFDEKNSNSFILIDSILLKKYDIFLGLLESNINKNFLDDDGDNALMASIICDNSPDNKFIVKLLPFYDLTKDLIDRALSINPDLAYLFEKDEESSSYYSEAEELYDENSLQDIDPHDFSYL